MLIDNYIDYISGVRRYSPRTCEIYGGILTEFAGFCVEGEPDDEGLIAALTPSSIRNYEVWLLDDRGLDARTVNLHLSVLSGFCRHLVRCGTIPANPVRTVSRPKTSKRLPVFYREKAMEEYFAATEHYADQEALDFLLSFGPQPKDKTARLLYEDRLRRLIISILYGTGIRRSELISLTVGSLDLSRRVLHVRGKGDKMREIPLVASLCKEILLYLQSVESMTGMGSDPSRALLLTASGRPLYPVYVDRAVKTELSGAEGISGRKSPHVLRHSLATGLLGEGTDWAIPRLQRPRSTPTTASSNSKECIIPPTQGQKAEVKMEINIKSLKFDADQKLIAFVEKKVSKLEKFHDHVTDVNVIMTLLHEPENKNVKIQIHIPGDELIIERNAKSFEDAVTECADAMKEKLTRAKEKRNEA